MGFNYLMRVTWPGLGSPYGIKNPGLHDELVPYPPGMARLALFILISWDEQEYLLLEDFLTS